MEKQKNMERMKNDQHKPHKRRLIKLHDNFPTTYNIYNRKLNLF